MSFVQPAFPLLLAVVLVLYWGLASLGSGAGRRRRQNLVLLLSSCVFYGWVHPWYLGLLAFSTLLDFGCGLGMARWPARRKALLVLSIAGNLGLLGTFKYLGFFAENWSMVLSAMGLHPAPGVLEIALPVGISFFTFQTLSYTIDVYRGKTHARRSLLDYATFVCMFPQLVAGPIERARNLLPQLEAARRFDRERFASGLGLALWGAVQKVVIADSVGLYVDRAWALPDASSPMIGAATVGFAVQILADFAGYTCMARGVARMMGVELMRNFRAPYAAVTPSEFWRRWHISLSSWFHEYVYIPLGGSRHTWARTSAATGLTLLLSGLWHGAAWHFVLWGAFHALLITGYRAITPRIPEGLRRAAWARPPAVALMFLFTCMGWLIFREPSLSTLWGHLSQPALGGSFSHWVAASVTLSVGVAGGLLLWLGGSLRAAGWLQRPALLPLRTGLWGLAILAIVIFSRDTARDFIYFRF